MSGGDAAPGLRLARLVGEALAGLRADAGSGSMVAQPVQQQQANAAQPMRSVDEVPLWIGAPLASFDDEDVIERIGEIAACKWQPHSWERVGVMECYHARRAEAAESREEARRLMMEAGPGEHWHTGVRSARVALEGWYDAEADRLLAVFGHDAPETVGCECECGARSPGAAGSVVMCPECAEVCS